MCKQTSNQGVTLNVSQNSINRKRTNIPVMRSDTADRVIARKKMKIVN